MAHRFRLRAALERYLTNAFQRRDNDQDVYDFFTYCSEITNEGLVSEEEMDQKAEEYQGSTLCLVCISLVFVRFLTSYLFLETIDEIVGAILFTERCIAKLRVIGEHLLREAGYIDSEKDVVV